MKQQNQRILLTKRGGDTYTVNIIKNVKTREKKLRTRSFWFSSCFTLTYSFKFKSEHCFTETTRKEAQSGRVFTTLVSIYIGVTHTFPTFLDLKGGLFF